MIGLTIADDHIVALTIAIPSMVSAAVGWLAWRTNRHARVAADSVRPNGQGTVIEISEEILSSQRSLHDQMQSLQVQQLAHEARDDARFTEIGERVARCEVRHADD